MSTYPNTGAPLWAAAQAAPWATQNEAGFIWDAFAARSIIEDRDLSAPPVSCADGARYLVKAPATGAWAGKAGQLAIAIGPNAANGWHFATVAIHGVQLFVRDEDVLLQHDGTGWITAPGGVSKMNDLTDVDAPSPNDGDVLTWVAGDNEWQAVAPSGVVLAPVATVSTQNTNLNPAHSGSYVRFTFAGAKTLTARPEATAALPANGEWNIRNAAASGNLTLVEGTAVTINPPVGGTLVIKPGGTVTLKRVAPDQFDLMGVTVAA